MFLVLPITPVGEGHTVFVLGANRVEFVTRFNYVVQVWTLDLLDANGALMIAGLIMVPNVNLLEPYPGVAALVGSLVVVEQTPGDYQQPFALGTTVQLLWYPVGTQVVMP